MRVTYANCFGAGQVPADLVLTDEVSVAQAAPPGTEVRIADERIDADLAQATNIQLWKLAFDWFRAGDTDRTVTAGVSAGDIAGTEIGLTVLLPAARGALGAAAALEGVPPRFFASVRTTGGPGNYDRIELVQCEAAEVVARGLGLPATSCERHAVDDPRDRILFGKYARSRDPDWLLVPGRARAALERSVVRVADTAAAALPRGRRPTLLVMAYNPTRAFVDRYAAQRRREYRLALYRPSRADLWRSILRGDRLAATAYGGRGTGDESSVPELAAVVAGREDELARRFEVDGWDLWTVVQPHLARVLRRYTAFVRIAAPRMRRELERLRVDAVLVPFESPAEARLLVRVAQGLGIPTFVLNNGFMGDDFQPECMTADVGLAWSDALARNYFSRRPRGRTIVTGNPRGDVPPRPLARRAPRALRRVLVGSLSYAPPDLNCRRSDPERFLDAVLTGIERSRMATDVEVLVKLHPADSVEQYDGVVARFGHMAPRLRLEGDVLALFEWCDVYVTTFSTSLIEAAAVGLPVVYYRVNDQRLHPPFSGDPWLAARTAATPDELASLLDGLPDEVADPGRERDGLTWSEQYLGPRDGQSVSRVVEAIREETAARP